MILIQKTSNFISIIGIHPTAYQLEGFARISSLMLSKLSETDRSNMNVPSQMWWMFNLFKRIDKNVEYANNV